MRNLLYKEFKLSIAPWAYIIPLLGVLLLIPDYPYFISLMYAFFITIPTTFVICKEQRDVGFSVLLPVRKRDIVKARYISIIAIEMLHILFAVIFGVINNSLYPQGNTWLMDINIAFFGFAFVMFAIFNAIFMTMFYKTAYKIAVPVFISISVTVIIIGLIEIAVQFVPALKAALDGSPNGVFGPQLLVLAGGMGIFVVSAFLSYKKSVKRFENIDV